MSYFIIFSRIVSLIFLIQLSLVVTAQNRLLLDRQFIYPGEQLGYSYINEVLEDDNLLYLAIVDLQSQEIVDFVFQSLEDKIIEGEILLGKDLAPGYYALFAAKYGDEEIYYEQFWIQDQLWQQLGGQKIFVSDEGDSLRFKGRISRPSSQLSIFLTSSTTIIDNPIELNDNGEFEFLVFRDSVIHESDKIPAWALVELKDENDRLAIHRFPVNWPEVVAIVEEESPVKNWLSITDDQFLAHVPKVGEFTIEAMEEIILIEDPIFPDDTISFTRSDLPTGKLILTYKPIEEDELSTEEIWNYPQVFKPDNSQNISVQGGEELILNLPELTHPWVSFGNHFISAKLDVEARVLDEKHYGTLHLVDTLDRTLDVITMRSSNPSLPRANRAVMFTNGEYLLDFTTDENGEFNISANEIDIFGFKEGRLRYREEERKVRLEAKYPAIEKIKEQMPFILEAMQPKILEKDDLFYSSMIGLNESIAYDENIIDLDEVIIEGKSREERISEVLNDPFAIDWLNEDWICQHGVLNGGLLNCVPVAGNHPSVRLQIPLHLSLDEAQLRRSHSANQSQQRSKFKILRGQTLPIIRLSPSERRKFEADLFHSAMALRSYSWDPDDYKDQIGSLKLPQLNKLLVSENDFTISNGGKTWVPYSEYPVLKIQAPNSPGTYNLEVRYWDLHHEISSIISYEVQVR